MTTALNGGGGGGCSMAAAAFDGNGDGLRLSDGEAKMGIDTSGGGWRRRASEFDGGNGWRFALLWTAAVVAVNDRDGVQWWRWRWRLMALAAFDYHGEGLWLSDGKAKMAGTTRGREGGAMRGNTTTSLCDERMRGRRNERTKRHDVTISWRDETTRGRRDKTRRQDGSESRGNATASRRKKEDESAEQQEDEERRCNNKLAR
jgi:hypothetical protein